MIAPSRLMVMIVALPAIVSLALFVNAEAWALILACDGAVLAIAILDLFTIPRKKRFRAERECSTVFSLGEIHRVALNIENRSRRRLTIDVRDDQLAGLEADPKEFTVRIPARSRTKVRYTLIPKRRGSYTLEYVYLRISSRLSLWHRYYRLPAPTVLRVYPDLKQISRYAMYARQNRLSLVGVRRNRRVGTDNEFERLRDYTPDDNHKAIDWRATGRRRRLIVRDFQSNQSQRVVFLIDSGRMMVNESNGMSLLDYSLDAMLMLSHVAMTRGDQAGLLTFSDRVHHWVPLGSGRRHLNRLVHAAHNLFPTLVESRYDSAFMHLNKHCRKRTLVVLVTNLIDQVNAHQVEAHLSNLVGKHLPLGVLLRDHEVFDTATAVDPATATGVPLYRAAAAADILDWRHQLIVNLRHEGALALDLFPENLTAPLINEYLRVKARHLL